VVSEKVNCDRRWCRKGHT